MRTQKGQLASYVCNLCPPVQCDKVFLPLMVDRGRPSRSLPKSPVWTRVQAVQVQPPSTPHAFLLRVLPFFGSRGSPFPESPARLMATSPALLGTLPKASGARALCPLVSRVGSFWRLRGRPSAVCPLPHALQSRALSCPSPAGEKGGLGQRFPGGLARLRTEVTTRW